MSESIIKLTPTAVDVLPPAKSVALLLSDLLLDYAKRDNAQPMTEWLAATLVKRSGADEQTAHRTAQNIINYIDDSHQLRDDLRQHLDKGKSRSSWIANQIEHIASETNSNPVEVAELSATLSGKTHEEETGKQKAWNVITRIDIAKGIEREALVLAAESVLEEGARKLASDVAEGLLQDSPETAKLTQDFINGKLDLASTSGMQATLATATEIATRTGLLGTEMKQALESGNLIPAWFAQQSLVGTENARLLHAVGTGALDPAIALDHMADVTTAAVTRTTKEICKKLGGNLGQSLAMAMPYIGPFVAPIGRNVGEFIGTTVGMIAGSVVGKVIKKGVEILKAVANKVVTGVKRVAKGLFHTLTLGLFT